MSGRVQKFRSIEEMNEAPLSRADQDTDHDTDDARFERFARHCARYWAIAPRAYPRGVFKFRSIEEAGAARERVAAHGKREPKGAP
jgi:hypothetical protein